MPPAIVGIVGKSKLPADSPYLTDAATIGAGIAEAGHIVMTGGHVDGDDPSVKHHALLGAKSVADAGHPVSFVGILPGTLHGRSDVKPWREGHARGSFLYTGLSASDRDLISGGAPDLLIALYGTEGTAKEVAAAIDADRPVVFVDSFRCLAPLLEIELIEFDKAVPTDPIEVATPAEALVSVFRTLEHLVPPRHAPRWIAAYRRLGLPSLYDDALRELRQ